MRPVIGRVIAQTNPAAGERFAFRIEAILDFCAMGGGGILGLPVHFGFEHLLLHD